MNKAQELAERFGMTVEQVEAIWAAQRAHQANEAAHRLHDDMEAEDSRARMHSGAKAHRASCMCDECVPCFDKNCPCAKCAVTA